MWECQPSKLSFSRLTKGQPCPSFPCLLDFLLLFLVRISLCFGGHFPFLTQDFRGLVFLVQLPFFPKDFRDSVEINNPCFGGFSLHFTPPPQKKKTMEGHGGVLKGHCRVPKSWKYQNQSFSSVLSGPFSFVPPLSPSGLSTLLPLFPSSPPPLSPFFDSWEILIWVPHMI